MIKAAETAELTDPFVHILELGDFSIKYRVAGLFSEVKQVISSRSRLYCMMLDELHEAGVEIVSPIFMNTRAMPQGSKYIPRSEKKIIDFSKPEETPEAIVFDKTEQAESREKLLGKYKKYAEEIEETKKTLNESSDDN